VPKHKPISIIPFWWLRKIQALWVKSKVTPPSPALDLGLKPGVPVCYVLPSRSVSDILVLYDVCERNGLPLPQTDHTSLNVPGTASFIYLHKMGLLQVERDAHKAPPTPLSKLVRMATLDPNMEVQLVPVCVFWGRNPGREERSILRLLFFDAEHAGILQKIFIVLAQGRDNFVNFGTPISLRRIVSEGAGIEQTAKKLRRVLRVHFRRQRTGVLGPSLPSRESVAASLLQSRAIKSACVVRVCLDAHIFDHREIVELAVLITPLLHNVGGASLVEKDAVVCSCLLKDTECQRFNFVFI
jgi:glycerol-3-phosphate O-acyltransferase